jgi:hypothetical protein
MVVAPIGNRLYRAVSRIGNPPDAATGSPPADYQSATQQVTNLRYQQRAKH